MPGRSQLPMSVSVETLKLLDLEHEREAAVHFICEELCLEGSEVSSI